LPKKKKKKSVMFLSDPCRYRSSNTISPLVYGASLPVPRNGVLQQHRTMCFGGASRRSLPFGSSSHTGAPSRPALIIRK
jgi:hypothetical protein